MEGNRAVVIARLNEARNAFLALILLAVLSQTASAGALATVVKWFTKLVGKAIAYVLDMAAGNNGLLAGSMMTLLTYEPMARPDVNAGSYLSMAGLVMGVIVPFIMFAILFTAIKFIIVSASPGERSNAKSQLQSLLFGLIIIPVSPHLYQVLINIAYLLTLSLLGNPGNPGDPTAIPPIPPVPAMPGVFQNVVGQQNFGSAVAGVFTGHNEWEFIFVFCCSQIATMLALTVLFIRHLMVVMLGVLMPLTCFLYLFNFTRSVGRKFLKYSITWALVPMIMSVWLIIVAITLTNTGDTGVETNTGTFMVIAFMMMMFASPLMITGALEAAGAVLAGAGQMTGGWKGAALVAVGQTMQADSPEALVSAGLKVGAGAGMKGLKHGMRAGVTGLRAIKAGGGAAALANLARGSGVMAGVARTGLVGLAAVSAVGRAIGRVGAFIPRGGRVGRSLARAARLGIKAGAKTAAAAAALGRGAKWVGRLPGRGLRYTMAKAGGAALLTGRALKGIGLAVGSRLSGTGVGAASRAIGRAAAWTGGRAAWLGRRGVGLGRFVGRGASWAYHASHAAGVGASLGLAGRHMGRGVTGLFSEGEQEGMGGSMVSAGNVLSRARVARQPKKASRWRRLAERRSGVLGMTLGALARDYQRSIERRNSRGERIRGWFRGKAAGALGVGGKIGDKMRGGARAATSRAKEYASAAYKRIDKRSKAGRTPGWWGRRTDWAVRSLSESAAGSGVLDKMADIAGMSVGGAMKGVVAFGATMGMLHILGGTAAVGALGVGSGIVPALAGIGITAYGIKKIAGVMGVGTAIGRVMRETDYGGGFTAGIESRGMGGSAGAYRSLKSSDERGGFVAGKAVGIGLDAVGWAAKTALVTAPMMGVEMAATGGLSLIPRTARALKSFGRGLRGLGGGFTAADQALKGESSKKDVQSVEGIDGDTATRLRAAGINSVEDFANATSGQLAKVGLNDEEGTKLHNSAVNTIREDNPYYKDTARDLGVSLGDAEKLEGKGLSNYGYVNSMKPGEFIERAGAAGATGITVDNVAGIQANAAAASAALAAGKPLTEEGKAEVREGAGEGATGTQAPSAEQTEGPSMEAGHDEGREGLWREMKEHMVYMGARKRRHKGVGEHLEEMLEDRDERPSG